MLYIARGTLLTPVRNQVTLYDFQLVTFDNVTTDVYKIGEEFGSDTDAAAAKTVAKFQNIKSLLLFKPFADAVKPTSGKFPEISEESSYVGTASWSAVKSVASGQLSKNGSVIPRILFPMANNADYLDNGLVTYTETTAVGEDGKKITTRIEDTEFKLEKLDNGKYPSNWEYKGAHKRGGKQLNIGKSHYITNEGTFDNDEVMLTLGDGSTISFSRSYTLSFHEGYTRGAFAILVGFFGSPMIEDKGVQPEASIYINTAPDGEENTGTPCVAHIGYDGDIMLDLANGSAPAAIGKISENKEYSANMTVPQKYRNDTLNTSYVVVFYPVLNGFVATSNFGSNRDDTGVRVPLLNDYSGLSGMIDPSIKDFPTKYKESLAENRIDVLNAVKKLNGIEQRFKYSRQMDIAWINGWGAFAYCPVRFSTRVVFDYFFKTGDYGTGNEVLKSEPGGISSGVDTRVVFYAIPIFADNGGKYKINKRVRASAIYRSAQTNVGIYRFRFTMASTTTTTAEVDGVETTTTVDNGEEKVIPGEMFGFVLVTERFGTISKAKCDDGEFTQPYSPNFLNNIQLESTRFSGGNAVSKLGVSWFEYIKSVNFTFGLDDVSGSITLDKYSIKGGTVYGAATQSIGAVSFVAKDTDGTTELGKVTGGVTLFRGYAMEVSDGASGGTGDFTANLSGIAKKLSDMKLVNCPFWDGDRLFGKSEADDAGSIMQYIKNYTGCRLYCSAKYTKKIDSDSASVDIINVRVPSSADYNKPAVDFGNTTSALEAINQLAKLCNHKFVIQPDGNGYFYQLDKYGVPHWVNDVLNTPVVLDRHDVISYSLTPFLENRYNHYITRSLIHDDSGTTGDNLQMFSAEGGMIEEKKSDVGDGMDFPWARFSITALQGFLTKTELQKTHDIIVRKGLGSYYQGSIKVRGIVRNFVNGNTTTSRSIWLYDKVSFQGVNYMVVGVLHNLDLSSKRWDTEISIARFKAYGEAGY